MKENSFAIPLRSGPKMTLWLDTEAHHLLQQTKDVARAAGVRLDISAALAKPLKDFLREAQANLNGGDS